MYLVAIAWIYVVLMMSLAEALSSQGTILGALFTFLLYGVLPLAVVLYIMATPQRKRLRQAREQSLAVAPDPPLNPPDGSGVATCHAVAPERKEV